MATKTKHALFDPHFLESYAGQAILNDPRVALMELVANAWDAGASTVTIKLPDENGDGFSIEDNGHGMTRQAFDTRYMTLGYQRYMNQGPYAEAPDGFEIGKRPAFGKNARGKLGAFYYGMPFWVRTWREGRGYVFSVKRSSKSALEYVEEKQYPTDGSGTEIFVRKAVKSLLSPEEARAEIGMRFLSDPCFKVSVNGELVTFADIPDSNIARGVLDVDGEKVSVTVIDTKESDRATYRHGIAWWVDGRLVGECTWKGTTQEHLFDGRRSPAKRYTFIVEADFLNIPGAILPDWSAFNPKEPMFLKANSAVTSFVHDYILELTKESREETLNTLKAENKTRLKSMPLVAREKWEDFVTEVQRECPSITDDDLGRVSTILAKLENAESKYGLLYQLSMLETDSLDDLQAVLTKWDVDLAKIVLDELEGRLKLIERIQIKVSKDSTHEVSELQPLFHAGLWIFGPEYESIEYTSNQTMTTVIKELFGSTEEGGLERPDFVILPNSTVGVYYYPEFDDVNHEEVGPARITIVELKRPGIPIGQAEKDQARDYAFRLLDRGLIKPYTRVTCFVLGDSIKPNYSSPLKEWDNERLIVQPLDYSSVLGRAKSRSLRLYDRVRTAPFLQDTRLEEFLFEKTAQSGELNFDAEAALGQIG